MGILKDLTKEYFGEKVRKEDEINIEGLDVDIVSFTDNNGKKHKKGYKPKEIYSLKILLKRMIEVRGDEGDFNDIDTSEIEDMEELFKGNETFNGDISGWDVSRVKNMHGMFCGATLFNQDIGKWELPNVEDMRAMFNGATSFNQDISKWNLPNVTDITCMFYGATSFNQDISNWDIRGVHNFLTFINCPIKDEFKPKMK